MWISELKVIKNDNKNKDETWRRAIRLLEKHLTRANRAQKLIEVD
jgi:hypothetical protein